MINHPCLSCGACCAFYKVAFHWSETLIDSHNVPLLSTESISPHRSAMKGTNQEHPQCIELLGVVGSVTSCQIYDRRPGCCRDFKASFENGSQNINCEEARFNKGLQFLTLDDWKEYRPANTV